MSTDPESVHWSLQHATEEKQINGLTYDQMRFAAALIPTSAHEDWVAWHEGLTEWRVLANFEILFRPIFKPSLVMPPLPPKHSRGNEKPKSQLPAPIVDQRLNKRFLKDYTVTIHGANGENFKCKTVNVSLGGMLLNQLIPPECGKNFRANLERLDGSSVSVFCSVVRRKDEKGGTRVKFLDVTESKVLLQWLVSRETGEVLVREVPRWNRPCNFLL